MDFDYLYLRSLKFLNFRPRSEKEIKDYLEKKLKRFPEIDKSIIDIIIHKLKEQKFLDDEEFAKWLVRSRTEFKPRGKYLVREELKQKGIAQDIIDDVMNSNVRRKTEKELAIDVLLPKRKKYEKMEVRERFTKAGSMLARRGFSLDSIRGAIDEVFEKMV